MSVVMHGKFRGFKTRKGTAASGKDWSMTFAGVESDGNVEEILLADGDEHLGWPALQEPVAVAVKVTARGNYPSFALRALLADPDQFELTENLAVVW